MSDQVNIGAGTAKTLDPGAEAIWGFQWVYLNANRWMRMSVSPDNNPSSIEILREWSETDVGNTTMLVTHYRNNGANVVVFRQKILFTPSAF